jgi:tRNA threonylcarbamoyl adenosine modification protein YeaZ/ribosomal-protein-alanine acetyltransferase
MRVLALDATSRLVSVAVVDDDRVLAERAGDPSRPSAEQLPGMLVDVMRDCAIDPASIDVFAVAAGPGSFTGIRIGIATIQGFACVYGRPMVPVSTLEALGQLAAAQANPGSVVAAWVDAFRGELFSVLYQVVDAPPFTDARLAELVAPTVATPDVTRATWTGDRFPAVAIGDGAVVYRALLEPRIRVLPRALLAGTIGLIGGARARRGGGIDPSAVQPIYIRRPDVEIERERKALPTPPRAPADPWVIEPVTSASSIDEVLAIEAASFTNPWTREMYAKELDLGGMSLLFLARDNQGRAAGFCSAWRVLDELHINNLAVVPEVRRHGVASALLKRTFSEGTRLGAKRATLEVRRSNVAARQLYERLGFVVTGVRSGYYTTPVEDALVLWRDDLDATGA